jgi:hypothetical protein
VRPLSEDLDETNCFQISMHDVKGVHKCESIHYVENLGMRASVRDFKMGLYTYEGAPIVTWVIAQKGGHGTTRHPFADE